MTEHELVPLQQLAVTPVLRAPHWPGVADRLTAMLILSDELLAEFQTEEANRFLWLEPHVRGIYAQIDSLVGRFAQ